MFDYHYLTPGDNVELSEKGLEHFIRWDDRKPREGYVTGTGNPHYIHVKMEGMPHMCGYRRDFWVLK